MKKHLILSMAMLVCSMAMSSAAAQTANEPASRFGGIRWADKFPGSTPSAQINAAMADCGPKRQQPGDSCLVVIPPGMGCGEPNQAPDNVMLWDLRGCAQSQGLRFNVSHAASHQVRSKVLLQDDFPIEAGTNPPVSSATLYVFSLPDSANRTTGSVAAINGSVSTNTLTGDFNGTLIGIEGEAFAALTTGGPYSIRDIRGGTFNTVVGKGIKAKDVTSLYAQAPINSSGGAVENAYSLRAEAPKIGTSSNLAGWFNGDVRVDTKLTVAQSVSVGGGTPISKMLIEHKVLDFAAINGNTCVERPVPVQQAAANGTASASPASALNGNSLLWSAWVSEPGTVAVRLCNVSNTPVKPAAVSWNVTVIQ